MALDYKRIGDMPKDMQEELLRAMRLRELVVPYAILSYYWEGMMHFRPLIPTPKGMHVTRKLLTWARHNAVTVNIQHIDESDLETQAKGQVTNQAQACNV